MKLTDMSAKEQARRKKDYGLNGCAGCRRDDGECCDQFEQEVGKKPKTLCIFCIKRHREGTVLFVLHLFSIHIQSQYISIISLSDDRDWANLCREEGFCVHCAKDLEIDRLHLSKCRVCSERNNKAGKAKMLGTMFAFFYSKIGGLIRTDIKRKGIDNFEYGRIIMTFRLMMLFIRQKGICFWCGTPMMIGIGTKVFWHCLAASPECIDSRLGHKWWNVRVLEHVHCNCALKFNPETKLTVYKQIEIDRGMKMGDAEPGRDLDELEAFRLKLIADDPTEYFNEINTLNRKCQTILAENERTLKALGFESAGKRIIYAQGMAIITFRKYLGKCNMIEDALRVYAKYQKEWDDEDAEEELEQSDNEDHDDDHKEEENNGNH